MSRNPRDEEYEIDEELENARPPRRRRRKKRVRRLTIRRCLILGLLSLALIAVFLPGIAALPMFRSALLGVANRQLNGRIEIDELGLGWFSPVRVGNLRIQDSQGNVVAAIGQLRTGKSLMSLVWNRTDLGEIEISQPVAQLLVRPGGSNLEDVLAKWMAADSSSSGPLPKMTCRIVDGSVSLSAVGSLQPAQFKSINGQLILGGTETAIALNATAQVHGVTGQSGQIQLDARAGTPNSPQLLRGQLTAQAQTAPIDAAGLAAARFGQSVDGRGLWSGQCTAAWTLDDFAVEVDLNETRIAQLSLEAPQYFGSDRLVAELVDAAGQIRWANGKLTANQLRCQSDFGQVAATGEFDWKALAQTLSGGALPQSDFQVVGNVDIARLTQMLPATMRLKPGVLVQKANLEFQTFSRMEGSRRRLLMNAEAREVAGIHAGQAIRLAKPIRAAVALTQNGPRTALESIQCETSSVSVTGQSDIQTGELKANGDLGQLKSELEQFLTLGEIALAGRFDGTLSWNTDQAALAAAASWPLNLTGEVTLEALEVSSPGWQRISEPQATLRFDAAGTAGRDGTVRIDSGKVNLVAAGDRLDAKLTQPIENPNWDSTLNAQVDLSGGLDTWQRRLQPFLPALDMRAAGKATIKGALSTNRSSARLQSAAYEVHEFGFDGFGMQIREPKVAGQADIAFDWSHPRLQIADMTVASSSVAGRAANVDVTFDASGFRVTGDVAYRADVNRLVRWFAPNPAADGVQWFGAAEGSARLTPVPNAIAGEFNTKIVDLAAAKLKPQVDANDPNPWQVLWHEPTAAVDAQLAIDPSWDKIQCDRLAVQSGALQVSGRGTVADLSRTMQLDLAGTWTPNWDALSAIAQGYAGRGFALKGQSRGEDFRIQGPLLNTDPNAKSLIHPQLVAQTSASWDSGTLLGMPVGAASLRADLKDAVLGLNDAQIQVGPGRFRLSPLLDLRGDPQLILPRGTVLESVELTPEVCQGWLKYVAPLLADVARARGRFSLAVDGFQVPLSQPLAGRGSGQLAIDQATLEPGPLGQQLVQLVNLVKQMADGNPLDSLLKAPAAATRAATNDDVWLQLPAQQIGFKLDQQQVIHEGMTLDIQGVQIKTRGAIGTDSAVNLVAEIPIQESWILKQPALAGLRGQSLQVPIGGSLSQPRLDGQALAQISRQLLQKAAAGQIESRLNGLLNDTLQKNLPQFPGGTSSVPAQPASSTSPLQPLGDSLQKSVQDNLLKGVDRLLQPRK